MNELKTGDLILFSSYSSGISNLISNFITQRKQLNMLPNKGEGYITAMRLADILEINEGTFWNNLNSIKNDYPQYNLNKINSLLSPEKITIKNTLIKMDTSMNLAVSLYLKH